MGLSIPDIHRLYHWVKIIGLSSALVWLGHMAELMWGLSFGRIYTIIPDWANPAELVLTVIAVAVVAVEIIKHIRHWKK